MNLSIFNVLFVFTALSLGQCAVMRRTFAAAMLGAGLCLPNSPAFSLDAIDAALRNSQISYSNNAKNFARLSVGDYSQGFKDVSMSPAAKKRRAVKGCKTAGLRAQSGLSERDCIQRTFNGDIQFMLDIIESDKTNQLQPLE
jgi:hypothetical protein